MDIIITYYLGILEIFPQMSMWYSPSTVWFCILCICGFLQRWWLRMANFFFQPNGIGEVHVQSISYQWMQITYLGQITVTSEKSGIIYVFHILIHFIPVDFIITRKLADIICSQPKKLILLCLFKILKFCVYPFH